MGPKKAVPGLAEQLSNKKNKDNKKEFLIINKKFNYMIL